MGAPAGTCYAAPATLGPYTHPRLGVDVPGMVRGAVHLGGDGDQVHLEVRGVPQLDDAGDSIWVQVWTAGELTPKPKEKKGCTKAISPVRVRSQPVDQGLWPAAGSRQW